MKYLHKNSIKTNSELPLCMLKKHNYQLNNIDFVLFHLYIANEEYREYYRAMRIVHPDRVMIFDNSGYEFYIQGKTLDMTQFMDAIIDLNPTYYILPDVLMDKDTTLKNAEKFLSLMESMKDKTTAQPLAVIQGNTALELAECMDKYQRMGLTNICVPFHNSFFKDWGYDPKTAEQTAVTEFFKNIYKVGALTDDMAYAAGRVMFVMCFKDMLNKFEYVHMLGSHCPFEKAFYGGFQSMDTGYPVKLGYERVMLGQESSKPTTIIDDFFTEDLSQSQINIIQMNVETFEGLLSDMFISDGIAD